MTMQLGDSRLSDSTALWYVPFERLLLQRLSLVGFGLAVVISGLELLRARGDLAVASLALAILFLSVRFALPRAGGGSGRLSAARLLCFASLALSLWMVWQSELSLYMIWARGAMLVLGASMAIALLRRRLRDWAKSGATNALGAETIADGLAYSRIYWPRYLNIEAHGLLIHACLLVLIPMVWITDMAFSPGNLLGGGLGDGFSLEHFEAMLGGREFWIWTGNSLIVAIGTTLVGLALAVPAAYAFSRFDFAGRKQAMFSFILVQMFPGAIILVPYFLVMKTLGLLNTALGLILVYSVTALPLCIWMLKGFFDAVPRELEEAAKLDGCSTAQIFFRIILPLSIPAIAVAAMFSFIVAWNEFMLALVFNTSNDQFTLPVGLASLIPSDNQRWGDFAAASILVSIPVVILFALSQRSLVQGLSSGAVKG